MKVTEIVVKLLGDLESHLRIEVVARSGSAPIPAPLLRELDLRSAHRWGELEPPELAQLYRRADVCASRAIRALRPDGRRGAGRGDPGRRP